MVMLLFEIKTASYKEKVIKREMRNLIIPRSNSMSSKTQQRTKTDKEVNETNVGKKRTGPFCESHLNCGKGNPKNDVQMCEPPQEQMTRRQTLVGLDQSNSHSSYSIKLMKEEKNN